MSEEAAYMRICVYVGDGNHCANIRNKSKMSPAQFMDFLASHEWIQIGRSQLLQVSMISYVTFWREDWSGCEGEI